MFTRSLFQTPDMIEQHNLLGRVAALIDEGVLKTTLSKVVPELTPSPWPGLMPSWKRVAWWASW
jgi:hypothetical protein